MKKKTIKKFENLDQDLFEPLSDDMLSRVKGGGETTTVSMPTYDPTCGCSYADSVEVDDTPPSPVPA